MAIVISPRSGLVNVERGEQQEASERDGQGKGEKNSRDKSGPRDCTQV